MLERTIHHGFGINQTVIRFFVSIRRIKRIQKTKKSNINWCLDSGGFTELSMYNGWKTTPAEYVESLARINEEIGNLVWASPQDWMCEPHMLKKTGLTVADHQHLTCENFVKLQQMDPPVRIIPVLQGWRPDDYITHMYMYARYGVDIRDYPTVGMGSFCRRARVQGVEDLVWDLHRQGVKMHGFGLKRDGLTLFGGALQSSDSMAWSFTARAEGWKGRYMCGAATHTAQTCGDCHDWAMMWADDVLDAKRASEESHKFI